MVAETESALPVSGAQLLSPTPTQLTKCTTYKSAAATIMVYIHSVPSVQGKCIAKWVALGFIQIVSPVDVPHTNTIFVLLLDVHYIEMHQE